MSDPGAFREIARTVRIEHPIPVICVVLVILSLGCLGWATKQTLPLAWFTEGMALVAVLATIGLPIYAVLRRPELLRSEHYTLTSRAMDMMLDNEVSETARSKAGEIVEGALLADSRTRRVERPLISQGSSISEENANE